VKKENAEKLVDALVNAWMLMEQADLKKLDDQFVRETAENLRDIVIDELTGDTGIVYREAPLTRNDRNWITTPLTIPTDDRPNRTTITCKEDA
jgi:hypothetical protein